MSVLTDKSQLLGPIGTPLRRFFPTYFSPCWTGPRSFSRPGPARWWSLASCPTHNARVGHASSSPPVGSRLRCSHPIDCIVQVSNRTHPSGSLEPRVRDCQVVATMTAGAEGPAVRFHTSLSRIVWLGHQGKKRPRGIRRLHQARRRRRSPLNFIYFKNKSCTWPHQAVLSSSSSFGGIARTPSGCSVVGGSMATVDPTNQWGWWTNKPPRSYPIPHDFDHLYHSNLCILKFSWLMHWLLRRFIRIELRCLLEDHVYTGHSSATKVHWFKVFFSTFWILTKFFYFFSLLNLNCSEINSFGVISSSGCKAQRWGMIFMVCDSSWKPWRTRWC